MMKTRYCAHPPRILSQSEKWKDRHIQYCTGSCDFWYYSLIPKERKWHNMSDVSDAEVTASRKVYCHGRTFQKTLKASPAQS